MNYIYIIVEQIDGNLFFGKVIDINYCDRHYKVNSMWRGDIRKLCDGEMKVGDTVKYIRGKDIYVYFNKQYIWEK